MPIKEIGCCGAYCATCRELSKERCHGCKLGYDNGERDIEKAKCRIKLCCIRYKKLDTCGDCKDFASCEIIQTWYNKKGYKYNKYRESIEFIRLNGYKKFIRIADSWKNQYGKLY